MAVAKWRVVNYFDVWGNARDGWEVNNLCEHAIITANIETRADVLKALKACDFLRPHVRLNMIDFPIGIGDVTEVDARKDGRPLCRLEWIEDVHPIGVWTLTNTMALLLDCLSDENEVAVVRWSDENVQHERRIHYTASGRAFIRFKHRRWYLDECMRVGH